MQISANQHHLDHFERIQNWKAKHLSQLNEFLLPIEGSKWGRLICTWFEKKPNGDILQHNYAAVINTKTLDVFLDCRPRKIFAKCMVSLFACPVYTFFKTIYHLSLIDVAIEILKAVDGDQTKKDAFMHSVRSIADIVRTPLFGIAMTITTLAGLAFGLIAPRSLYDTRALLGKLEQSLHWGEKRTLLTLAPCFQPFSLVDLTDLYQSPGYEDTIYLTHDPIEVTLAHYARWAIRIRRKKHNFFDQLQGTLNPYQQYLSKSLEAERVETPKPFPLFYPAFN